MEFKKVVLLGGGVLGSQIAIMSAYTGHDTTIWLRSQGSVERTEKKVSNYKTRLLADLEGAKNLIGNPMGPYVYPRGLIRKWEGTSQADIEKLLEAGKKNLDEKLHLETDLDKALADADIIIEAMAEDPKAKISMYESIKDKMDEKTILCTNTSTLLPSTFAEYTGRPEKYMALHFANEIWKHNTAECMGHEGTDPEVYDQVVKFADQINMIPIKLKKEQGGYVLNTLLVPLLEAAQYLWSTGIADPEMVDITWKVGTGSPKGPFEIMDIIGLQTVYNIVKMKEGADQEGTYYHKLTRLLKEKLDKGESGINAGKGFYDYSK
ncbi:MAG: 3-hydroxyacyl-CoA dehydrogenase [Bacillota bacterium]|nr:3-hydroxyacyl-CoA dehydrogenase [Bacillota bacterium]